MFSLEFWNPSNLYYLPFLCINLIIAFFLMGIGIYCLVSEFRRDLYGGIFLILGALYFLFYNEIYIYLLT